MKKYRNITTGVGLGLVGLLNGCASEQKHNITTTIENYEQILNSEMAKNEEEIGIKHFGIPEKEFIHDKNVDFSASYNPETDIMYFRSSFSSPFPVKHEELDHLYLHSVVSHELGHFYVDKLSESLGWGNWPQLSAQPNTVEWVEENIISEGIGTYFQGKTLERITGIDIDNIEGIPPFDIEKEWPKDIEILYDGHQLEAYGQWLVKPIIDKHGEKGIEYLITHQMEEDELLNPKSYQERALEALSSQGKDKE